MKKYLVKDHLSFLAAQCLARNDPQIATIFNEENTADPYFWPSKPYLQNMFDVSNKLTGCLIQKAACSTWHAIFWILREGEKARR